MKKVLLVAGVVALTTVATQVFAQNETNAPEPPIKPNCERPRPEFGPAGPQMQRPPHEDFQKIADELNLTDKQKEQAKQLREKQMEAAKPLFEQLKANEQQSQAIRDQLRDLRQQGKKDFESILTDKQLKKLEKIKEEHKKDFKKHQGDMNKRPPMPPQCNCKGDKPPVEK